MRSAEKVLMLSTDTAEAYDAMRPRLRTDVDFRIRSITVLAGKRNKKGKGLKLRWPHRLKAARSRRH